jgi:hypothetical protein
MEESLVPSSMYKISSLSVDSRFADQNYGTPPDTSDFMIHLPEPMKNVMRIRLTSTEIPPVEQVFTVEKDNVGINIYSDVSCTILIGSYTLPSGNYTVTSLCAAIQTYVRSGPLGFGFTCSVDPVSGRITIGHTTTSLSFTVSFGASDPVICGRKTHWGLGYYLGFRVPYVDGRRVITISGTAVTAYAAPLVMQNSYYLLQVTAQKPLNNFVHRTERNSSVPAFAKIVMRGTGAGVDYDDNSDLIRKEYTFLAPANITQLRITLLDPFGVPVRLATTDWSMTFEFTEVVNARTYENLNKTYNS